MRASITIGLLIISNAFMTLAWYGHLKLAQTSWFTRLSLPLVILFSWGIALFEYAFQVPANRLGFAGDGGPFDLWQLKIAQEVITLVVFSVFTLVFFREQTFKWNYLVGFGLIVLAVYVVFKDWS